MTMKRFHCYPSNLGETVIEVVDQLVQGERAEISIRGCFTFVVERPDPHHEAWEHLLTVTPSTDVSFTPYTDGDRNGGPTRYGRKIKIIPGQIVRVDAVIDGTSITFRHRFGTEEDRDDLYRKIAATGSKTND